MYPQRELIRLAAYKAALRRDVARRRAQCAGAAARVAQPLAWLDRTVDFWRRLSPLVRFAAVPLALLGARAVFSRRKILGSLVRWAPLVFGAGRVFGAAVETHLGERAAIRPDIDEARTGRRTHRARTDNTPWRARP